MDINAIKAILEAKRKETAALSAEEREKAAALIAIGAEVERDEAERREARKASNVLLRLELDEKHGKRLVRFVDHDPACERPDGHPSRYALRRPTGDEFTAFENALSRAEKDPALIKAATRDLVTKCLLFPEMSKPEDVAFLHDHWKNQYPGEVTALGGIVAELAGLMATEARKSG